MHQFGIAVANLVVQALAWLLFAFFGVQAVIFVGLVLWTVLDRRDKAEADPVR